MRVLVTMFAMMNSVNGKYGIGIQSANGERLLGLTSMSSLLIHASGIGENI